MTSTQRPWYLVSISFRCWWNLSPGSSLIEPMFSGPGTYVKLGSESWRSCFSPGLGKQSPCCWLVKRILWSYCCQESSSLPEQIPSTLLVPLRSLRFWTQDLWWSVGSEDRQRCLLSSSPWSILEKPGTSKWNSHNPCLEPWWTTWLSRAWCTAMGRVFCLCPPEGLWRRSFLCKALNPPAKASPSSCNAEHGPYYPTCTENIGTWWSQTVVPRKSSPSSGQHKQTTYADHNHISSAHTSPLHTSPSL